MGEWDPPKPQHTCTPKWSTHYFTFTLLPPKWDLGACRCGKGNPEGFPDPQRGSILSRSMRSPVIGWQ